MSYRGGWETVRPELFHPMKMATTPVFKCRGCGRPVYGTLLEAPDEETLKQHMAGLAEIAMCKDCKARYNHFASLGRSEEFKLNPHLVLLNVVDVSGADYYGRQKGNES